MTADLVLRAQALSVDLGGLTGGQREALKAAAAGPLWRVRDGWRHRGGGHRWKADTLAPLERLGLVERRVRGPAMVATALGAAVAERLAAGRRGAS